MLDLEGVMQSVKEDRTAIAEHYRNEIKAKTISAEELIKMDVSEIPTLLEPIFPKVGLIGFAGSSDVGKSSLVRHFAVSVVLGQKSFIGMSINAQHNRAIYVSSEDSAESLAFLLQKLNNEYKLPASEYRELKFITETENLLERLELELQSEPTDLIVLDTFGDLYGRSMNESNQVRSFLNDYSQLAQKYQCLVIVLHHTGKRTDEFAPSKHNLLGSQGFESKMRLVVELRPDRHKNSQRHFCIVKGNYLPREFKESSIVLEMNDNFYFSATGGRVSFEHLGAAGNTKQIELEYEVLELAQTGISQTAIAEKLGTNQPKVSRILSKNKT